MYAGVPMTAPSTVVTVPSPPNTWAMPKSVILRVRSAAKLRFSGLTSSWRHPRRHSTGAHSAPVAVQPGPSGVRSPPNSTRRVATVDPQSPDGAEANDGNLADEPDSHRATSRPGPADLLDPPRRAAGPGATG